MNAPVNLELPPLQADGTRLTVNTGVTGAQAVWSLRSAYNVAALNCMKNEHASILPGYSAFLRNHARLLKKVNADLDRKFKAENGAQFIKVREAYQTQIYNFFAFPPVLPAFCDAAVVMAREISGLSSSQLENYAPGALARLDQVFQNFFASYARYQADLAIWEERYGTG
ncbi:MAG: hypothetical protein N2Z59_00700, partial [Alteraurantiacibacter sp.]|nr:hypothetical protein [Alteraurantiacibacter sp.]